MFKLEMQQLGANSPEIEALYSTDTFSISSGVDGLNQVINGFNYFTEGKLTVQNHIAGTAATGGDLEITEIAEGFSTDSTVSKNDNRSSFYVHGALLARNGYTINEQFSGHTIYLNPDVNIPIAYENRGWQKPFTYKVGENGQSKIFYANDYVAVKLSNSYINFDDAFAKLQRVSNDLAKAGAASDTLDIPAGSKVTLTEDQAKGKVINIVSDELIHKDEANFPETIVTIQGNPGSLSVKNNGQPWGALNHPYWGGHSMKMLWNFPDATSINLGDNTFGHILAPNAHVTAGNIDGSVIAKSATARLESHAWGGSFTPPETPPEDPTGKLAVAKTLEGDIAAANLPDDYKVEIKVFENGDSVGTVTFTKADFVSGDTTKTVAENISVEEHTYTVTETVTVGDANGQTLTIGSDTYTMSSDIQTGGYTVAINTEAPQVITVTNTYEKQIQYGKLAVAKTLAGVDAAALPNDYQVAIKVEENGDLVGTATFTKADFMQSNLSKTVAQDIPVGAYTYTVTETVTGTGATDDSLTINGKTYKMNMACDGAVTIEENTPGTLTVTNTYAAQVGELVVNKQMSGIDPTTLPEEYTVTINIYNQQGAEPSDNDPVVGSVTFSKQDLINRTEKRISNIPAGEYNLWASEIIAGVDWDGEYQIISERTYSMINSVSGTGLVTVENERTHTVTVNNDYTALFDVSFGKEIVVASQSEQPEIPAEGLAVEFTLAGDNFHRQATVTFMPDELDSTKQVTFENIPEGVYTLTEKSLAGSWATSIPNGIAVAVTEDGTVIFGIGSDTTEELTVTNTYDNSSYKLTITKAFRGEVTAAPEGFYIEVVRNDEEEQLPIRLDASNADSFANGVYTWTLTRADDFWQDAGSYTVTEYGYTVNSYILAHSVTANGATTATDNAVLTLTEDNKAGKAEFVNTYADPSNPPTPPTPDTPDTPSTPDTPPTPDTPSTPTGGGGSRRPIPEVEIPDNPVPLAPTVPTGESVSEPAPDELISVAESEVPLAEAPETPETLDEQVILEQDVPLGDAAPRTGDPTPFALVLSLMAASAAGLWMLMKRRKDA